MRRKNWTWMSLVTLIVVALVVGCGGYGDDDDSGVDDDDDNTADDDDDDDGDDDDDNAYPAGPYGKELGSVMADFMLKDADGNEVRLSDYYGTAKAVLINQSAGWCTACRSEMGMLMGWYDSYKDQGLVVLQAIFEKGTAGVPADEAFVQSWEEEYSPAFPVLVDPDNLFLGYSPTFQGSESSPPKPLNLLLNDEMVIVYAQDGEVSESFSGQIENLLGQE